MVINDLVLLLNKIWLHRMTDCGWKGVHYIKPTRQTRWLHHMTDCGWIGVHYIQPTRQTKWLLLITVVNKLNYHPPTTICFPSCKGFY